MKIEDELIYTQYANWRLEHDELITFVEKSKTSIKNTFEHVLPVVEYLYNELIDNEEYGEEEDGIFQFGFQYLVFKYNEIKYILDHFCKGDYEKLESLAKTINLLFHVLEFEQALLENESANADDIDKIIDLEKEIEYYLERCENAPEELFKRVDEKSNDIFVKGDYEFESIESIFASIAVSLEID
ncbi:MAG: hypothetical protein ACOX56_06680 [Acholeplasmataceae bacterium]|jgi:hypothetical protein